MDKLSGPWSKVSVVLPKTGEFYNRYFYKRKPAYRVVVDTPKAAVLAGYTLIEKDLRSVLIWLHSIQELMKGDEKFKSTGQYVKADYDRDRFNQAKGLTVAALTFYGKCFSTCEGRRVKLDQSNLSEEFQDRHNDAMSYRHNFAAHSGAKKLESSVVVVALDMKQRAVPYMVRELIQPDTYVDRDIEEFIELTNHAKEFADKKIGVLSEKVYEEDVLQQGPDHWYGLAKK